jgi:hypothetical protein
MFDVLYSLLALGVMALSAFGLGRPALRKLAIAEDDPLAVCVWSLALGLLLFGSALLLLAWAGWLYPPVIAAMSLAASLWALVELACLYLGHVNGRLLNVPSQPAPAEVSVDPQGTYAALVLCGVVLTATLLVALAPPTSSEALSRSLAGPKNMLLAHGLAPSWLGTTAETNIVQMWFLWALTLDGPVAAGLVHWGLGLLLALATALLARPFLGRGSGVLAASLVLLCPGVQCQMGAPLEDLAVALFTTLAAVAVSQVLVHCESCHWAIAAGLMLGGAAAANPAGLLFAAAVGGIWTLAIVGQRAASRPLKKGTGSEWIGVSPAKKSGREVPVPIFQHAATPDLLLSTRGLLWATVPTAGPWLVVSRLDFQWGPPQPLASALAHLGPILVIACGGLMFARRLRGLNVILGLLMLYGALAVLVPLHERWWSPLVPLCSVVAVWVWREMDRLPRPARWLACCVLGAVALAGVVEGCRESAGLLAVATGWQRRDDFLLAREPSYRAASLVNRIGRPDDRVFCQDAQTFYFACPAANPSDFPASGREAFGAWSERQWVGWARAAGYSYLLLANRLQHDSRPPGRAGQMTAGSPLAPRAADEPGPIGPVMPILEYRFADDNNRYTRYRLLKLR